MKTKLAWMCMLAAGCGGKTAQEPPSENPVLPATIGPTADPSMAMAMAVAPPTVCVPSAIDIAAGQSGLSHPSIAVNGETRTYTLFAPSSRPSALPLVFVFSDNHSTGGQIRDTLALEAQANGGAIFVYPDGAMDGSTAWDTTSAPDKNWDLPFFDAMLTNLKNQFCVSSVFAVGFKNGATWTNYLGCMRGDQLRAIATEQGDMLFWDGSHADNSGQLICPTPAIPVFEVNTNNNPDNIYYPYDFEGWLYRNHDPKERGDWSTTNFDPPGCIMANNEPPGHPVMGCFIYELGDSIWPYQASMVWNFIQTLK